MEQKGTLLLNRSDIASLLEIRESIQIVENAYRLHAEGKTLPPGLLHIDSDDGEFHVKAGGVRLDRIYYGLKNNGGFFQNMTRYGMPNIQGLIILCDGGNGYPLALFESGYITIQRTGAATAVAARYLARPDSSTVTICGCGTQGKIQLRALKEVLPLEKAFAFDADGERAVKFAETMSSDLKMDISPAADLSRAVQESDICVTCTPSRQAFLRREHLHEGLFIAAVGADSPEKQELEPEILVGAKVVADMLDQCVAVGEIHHAIEKGLMTADQVHAEIGDVIIGKRPGRTLDDEITVFDATGTALQDVATAAAVYEKALERKTGTWFNFQD